MIEREWTCVRVAAALLVIGACAGLLAPPAHAEEPAQPPLAISGAAGDLVVLADTTKSDLIVVDAKTRRIARYARVSSGGLELRAVRSLDDDLAKLVEAPPRTLPSPPSVDVPGEDPPGWKRPKGWVRVRSRVSRSEKGDSWDVSYEVGLPLADKFESVLETLADWTVHESSVSNDAFSIGARRKTQTIEVSGVSQSHMERALITIRSSEVK